MQKEIAHISVVSPLYNEHATVRPLVERIIAALKNKPYTFEIILIDDGSSDTTLEILKQLAAEYAELLTVIALNRNYGQHAALFAGFNIATGDVVVTIDADLQDYPEEIPQLIKKSAEGFDVVGGIRQERKHSIFRAGASRIVNAMMNTITGMALHDYGCMLRAYQKNIIQSMLACREQTTFIPVLANSFARHITEIPVKHAERVSGKSKYSLWKLINLYFDLLTTCSFVPVRILSIGGVCISILSSGFGLLLIILRMLLGPEWSAYGVFTLFAILFFFIGLQFVALGLLGEYIGRMYKDVRSRPKYVIWEIYGKGKNYHA